MTSKAMHSLFKPLLKQVGPWNAGRELAILSTTSDHESQLKNIVTSFSVRLSTLWEHALPLYGPHDNLYLTPIARLTKPYSVPLSFG